MKEYTEKEALEMIERRAESVQLGNVVYWRTSLRVFEDFKVEYPTADYIKSYQAEQKYGNVTLLHFIYDKDGTFLGVGNDSSPCPPLC